MSKIPAIDSIAELARFCDEHDLTESEEDLEEVEGPVLDREGQTVLRIRLLPEEASALHRIAQSNGVDDTDLVRKWVNDKLSAS